jgi:hypothetical protein
MATPWEYYDSLKKATFDTTKEFIHSKQTEPTDLEMPAPQLGMIHLMIDQTVDVVSVKSASPKINLITDAIAEVKTTGTFVNFVIDNFTIPLDKTITRERPLFICTLKPPLVLQFESDGDISYTTLMLQPRHVNHIRCTYTNRTWIYDKVLCQDEDGRWMLR